MIKTSIVYWIINQHLQREFEKTQTVKRDRSVCWQLMLLDLMRLSRAVGEASSGKLSGKQYNVDRIVRGDLS